MLDVKKVADAADIIVSGYAFTKDSNFIRVLNLANPNKALVLSFDDEVLETDMDDIEISIVLNHFKRNKKYLEEDFDA